MHFLFGLLVISALQGWADAGIVRRAVVTVAEGRSHQFSGGSLRLTCDVPVDPSPDWTFDWFFNGKPLSSNQTSYQIWHTRVFQSGSYTCAAARESVLDATGILRTHTSAPVHVDIDGGWIILEAPIKPMIMEETMTLQCRIRQNRIPTQVIFYLNGKEIWRQQNGTLTVRNLTLEHAGEYSCRATWRQQGLYHSAQSTGVSVTILEILETPYLSASIIAVERKKKNLRLTCVTSLNTRNTAAIPIHYYFLKNNDLMGPSMSRSTFIIPNVDKWDSARYSCRVSVPRLGQHKWSSEVKVDIPWKR